MHAMFILLISIALALGIFSAAVQRGANIVKLDRRMAEMGVIAGALQLLAAAAGYGIGHWILGGDIQRTKSAFLAHVLAGVLLAVVGARMLMVAFQKKTLFEHRMEKIDMKADVLQTLKLCVNSLLAGVACGIMRFNLLSVILTVFAATAVCSVIGYISGRAYGGEQSSRIADAVGGGLLCAVGVLLQIL